MKTAIIGANGFIGTRLTEHLHLSRFSEVRPIIKTYPGMAGLSRFKLDFRVSNALDKTALAEALNGCDVIVHCVAGDPSTIIGTIQPVYAAAQESGVQRIIYLSSAMVHGQMPAPGTDEQSPLDSRQMLPYNNAKVRAEKLLQKLRKKGKVEIVILRPGIVYGPRSMWITRFVSELLSGDAFLINEGKGICNSIYIDNLIHAIKLAMTEEDIDQEAFLVRDTEQITWADLYRPLVEFFGGSIESINNLKPPFHITEETSYFDKLTNNKVIKSIASPIPKKYRLSLYSAASHIFNNEKNESDLLETAPKHERSVDLERLMLYKCEYAMPWKKAYKYLNYEPQVSFTEGIRRTLAWLEYAGFVGKQKITKVFELNEKST